MHFWRSKTGKLAAGGCGTQVGMLLTCGVLTTMLLFCAVFVFTSGLSISLSQQNLEPPPTILVEGENSSPPGETESLLKEVDLLLGQVDSLQVSPVAPLLPTATPVAPSAKPMAMAKQNGANLYNGPGPDHDTFGVLRPDESREIVGRNIESNWWLIATPDGRYGWVSNMEVATFNINDSIPIVTTAADLEQLASAGFIAPTSTSTPTATATPTPFFPPGTPTPDVKAERQYVENLPSYQKVKASLLVPPVSASFSPDGSQVTMTEQIKLYTFMTDGAYTDIWLEDNEEMTPIGNIVWSPDGEYIAFVVGLKQKHCRPCRAVGLLRPSDGSITFLEPPEDGLDTDMPRWTQEGHLLINVHPGGEPADGVAYIYDVYGHNQEASGVYLLSSSHEGQKWYPWLPGRIWRAGVSERADSYNSD